MNPQIGLTRNVVRRNYALLTPDGYVPSVLPGWTKCTPYILISAALGARLVQMVIDFEKGGGGRGETDGDELVLYVLNGRGTLNKAPLGSGSFAYVPPGTTFDFRSGANSTQVLIFRKNYEPLDGLEAPAFFTGHERDVAETPFHGDPRARLKTLLPDSPEFDLAVNIFTYDPGATLPFVETHVMEHGMLFPRPAPASIGSPTTGIPYAPAIRSGLRPIVRNGLSPQDRSPRATSITRT
jgi:(S)-ureidoglycine aminohydrolase